MSYPPTVRPARVAVWDSSMSLLLLGSLAFAQSVGIDVDEEEEAIVPGTEPSVVVPESEAISWNWPVYGRVTSHFGWRRDPKGRGRRMHAGIDIAAAPGRTVRAAGKGTVRFAGRSADYGLMVEIAHPDGHRTRYAHMSKLSVRRGQAVEGGDPVGAVGNTGRSTGPHLHFELRDGRKPVDPLVIAINFTDPVNAQVEQKGPVLRVPGLPRDRLARTTSTIIGRVRDVATMLYHWWGA